jgi:serine/threonine protein kinase
MAKGAPQPAVCALNNPDHPTWQRFGSHRGQSKSKFILSKVNKTLTLIGKTQTLWNVTDGQTDERTNNPGWRCGKSARDGKVMAVPRFGNEGDYGEIRKVRISRVANIPTVVDFVGKMSKVMSEEAKRKEQAVEAMAWLIEHPRLIKFWAVNSQTMEAYTLWWNGGCVRSFWKINSEVSPALENQYIFHHPNHTMQELEMILAYRTKSAKLTMSLIMTMARVHKSKILHNVISPSNILLHFPPDHVDRVYIGVCDWGMETRFIEKVSSMYGYPTKEEMEKNKKEHFWVALELFYVYGLHNSET